MGSGSWDNSFHFTMGNNQPISKKGDVRYNKKKYEEYLLNLDHPQGSAKAKFFKETLGYSKDDSKLLHKKYSWFSYWENTYIYGENGFWT